MGFQSRFRVAEGPLIAIHIRSKAIYKINSMSRLVFIFSRKGQDPGEKPADPAKETLLTTMTCQTRTANFLGIAAQAYQPTGALRPRKGYTRSVLDAAGLAKSVVVPAGEASYLPPSKALGKTVTLKTGLKTPGSATQKPNYRIISMTFGTAVTVGQIAEFLAEVIPDTVIQRTTGAPSATEIFAQFTLKGGRTYPIGLKASAEASTDVNVPSTPAEQATVVTTAK